MSNKEEIAELRAELTALKRQLSGEDKPTEADVARYRDEMHQASEARASAAATLGFSKADLDAMRAACPDDVCRDLARDARAPLTPKSVLTDEARSNVRGRVSGGSGWQTPTAIKNGLGQGR